MIGSIKGGSPDQKVVFEFGDPAPSRPKAIEEAEYDYRHQALED